MSAESIYPKFADIARDEGFEDVAELFGNNIPYELRLRDAIINDLIVPFHYYGIRDELVDYGLADSAERRLIAQISDEGNCDFISQ